MTAGRLALKMMSTDWHRTGMAALAMGAAAALMLLFLGFREGLFTQMERLPAELPTDLIVAQAGTRSFVAGRSTLPQRLRIKVEEVPGVEIAHPIVAVPLIYSEGSARSPILVIAYDTLGGPQHIVEGGPIDDARELVVDESLARRFSLLPGARVEILGLEFSVAGISSGTSSFFTPIVYTRYDDLVDIYLSGEVDDRLTEEPALLSYLLVETSDDADIDTARERIRSSLDDVDVFTPAELGKLDRALGVRSIGSVLAVLVGTALGMGCLTSALATFASTAARHRDYAVLRAIGMRRATLGRAVVVEALVVGLLSLPVALGGSVLASWAVSWRAPQYLVLPFTPAHLAFGVPAILAMSSLGGLLALGRVFRIDPALAFRR